MKKLGPLMIAMGIGHAVIGIVLFNDVFMAIVREGFWNTIQPPGYSADPDYDRIAFFWLVVFSPVLSMLGQVTHRAILRGSTDILRVVGWNLLGIGLVGTLLLPVSGNPALIVLAILILTTASRVEARRSHPSHGSSVP